MFDAVNAQLEESDQLLRDSTDKLDRLQSMNSMLSTIVGTAQTEDGYVRVEHTAAGLHELVIEPRAMRMPSADLAEAIKQTLAAAAADFRAQSVQALQDADLLPSAQSQQERVAQVRERLAAATERYHTAMRGAAQQVEHAVRQARPT